MDHFILPDGTWNSTLLQQCFPPSVTEEMLRVPISGIDQDDVLCWGDSFKPNVVAKEVYTGLLHTNPQGWGCFKSLEGKSSPQNSIISLEIVFRQTSYDKFAFRMNQWHATYWWLLLLRCNQVRTIWARVNIPLQVGSEHVNRLSTYLTTRSSSEAERLWWSFTKKSSVGIMETKERRDNLPEPER